MTKHDLIAALFIASGLFLLIKGLANPILTGSGGGLLMCGLARYSGAKIRRGIVSGALAACGAFWLPGLIAGAQGVALLWLIAFVFIGTAVRVGLMFRTPANTTI